MPRNLQAFPQNNKITHNPTIGLRGNPLNFIGDNPFATMTDEILFGAVNGLLADIDTVTGLDLLPFAQMVEGVLGTPLNLMTGMMGFLTPGLSSTGPNVFSPITGGLGVGSVGGLLGFLNPSNLLTGAGIFSPILGLGGLFLPGLIPGLDASKITSGAFPLSMITGLIDSGGTIVTSLLSVPLSAITGLLSGGTILGSLIPGLDVTKIISGVFGLGFIPNLPASQTTSGTFGSGLIPGLDASKITSGIFGLSQLPTSVLTTITGVAGSLVNSVLGLFTIPGLPGSQITSGTVSAANVASLDGSKLTTGQISIPLANSVVLNPDSLKATFAATIARADTANAADTGELVQRFPATNLMRITSNVLTPTTVNASSWAGVTAGKPMATNNHYVEATVSHAAGVNDNHVLWLGSNNDFQVMLWFLFGNTAWIATAAGVYTGFAGGRANRQQSTATISLAAADVIRLERTDNVYTAKRNGTLITGMTWTDSGGVVPSDYQHRDTGAALQMVTAGHGFTTLTSGDL